MIRKLLLPATVAVLLGGCMAGGYNYRSGPGDYYYGQPSVDYRHYGSPYGGYYGYPGYYRHRYGFYGGYFGYPYYPRYYYRPRPDPQPDDGDAGPVPSQDNDDPPPWRNLDDLRRRTMEPEPTTRRRAIPQSRPEPPRAITPRASRRPDAGSRMERLIRERRGRESDERRIPR